MFRKVNGMNTSPAKGESAGTLTDIHDIEELKKLFNQDQGVLRLILLFSPT